MAGDTRDDGEDEDPLSRHLHDFFLKNIIPAVAETARREAMSAADDYIAKVRLETAEMSRATAERMAEIDSRSSALQEQARRLAESASAFADDYKRQRTLLQEQVDTVERNTANRLETLVDKVDLGLRKLTARRDQLNEAAATLCQLHEDVKAENERLLEQSDQIAAMANGTQAGESELARLAAASRAAGRPKGGEPGSAATKKDEVVVVDLATTGADSKNPPGPAGRTKWTWWRPKYAAMIAAAVVLAIVIYLSFFSNFGSDRSAANSVTSAAPTAQTAPDKKPDAPDSRTKSLDAAWTKLIASNRAVLPQCANANTNSCRTFGDAWNVATGTDQGAQARTRVLQLILQEYSAKWGCPRDLKTLKVDGDFGATTQQAADQVATLCLHTEPLPDPPSIYDAEDLAEAALLGMNNPPAR